MQSTHATSEIALIGPTADVWSNDMMARGPFHQTPKYLHLLWENISQLGVGCDYVHPNIIETADLDQGSLKYGSINAEVLIVTEVKTMRPETAEAIQRFTENGGKVIFVGDLPSRSPGLQNITAEEKRINSAIEKSLKANAVQIDPPSDLTKLFEWTQQALDTINFRPKMKVLKPREGLYTLRKQTGDEDVIFIANTYQGESSRTRVRFDLGEKGLWRWDPETGQRSPYDLPYNDSGFEVDLRPVESILLVTGANQAAKNPRIVSSDDVSSVTIDSPWTVTFEPAQEDESFSVEMPTLIDFTESKKDRIVRFSGIATYMTRFRIQELQLTLLDLGWDNAFISEVSINGISVGTNWYGSKLFDLSEHLKQGENQLTVKYTTTLNNKMNEPVSAGLIGPIRLIKKANH
jgi:hypothetical protein